MFLCEKVSEAAAKTATSAAPAASRRVEPLEVGGQNRVADPRSAFDPLQDRGGVGHLGDPAWGDEAGRLDGGKAAAAETVDEADLDRRRHALRLVLQPVPRADLDYFDAFGQAASQTPSAASKASSSAPSLHQGADAEVEGEDLTTPSAGR